MVRNRREELGGRTGAAAASPMRNIKKRNAYVALANIWRRLLCSDFITWVVAPLAALDSNGGACALAQKMPVRNMAGVACVTAANARRQTA